MIHQENQKIFTTEVLLEVLFFTVVIWIMRFYWGKRHAYQLASRIPGIPGYPILGNAMEYMFLSNSDFVKKLVSIGQIYKPLCKIWLPNHLFILISEPDHLEYILNSPKCLEKSIVYELVRPLVGLGLFTAPVNIWKKNRKIINPTFNRKILNRFLPVFNRHSKIFTEHLVDYVGVKTVDIVNLTSVLAVNTLCDTVMRVDVADRSCIKRYGQCLDKALGAITKRISNALYFFDFFFYLTKLGRDFDQAISEMNLFIKKVIKNKIEAYKMMTHEVKNDEADDKKSMLSLSFLDQLIRLSSEGINLTNQEMEDEVKMFMAAGSDTTANTLAFCFLTLGIQSREQEKVYQEVIDLLGEDRDITLEDLRQLQYTERFIKETMRIFPIGSLMTRTSRVDIKLGDYDIPADSSLCLFPLLTHRDPKYWKDPMKFDTDRFCSEEIAKRHPYSFIPFSGGPRGCIGIKYAYMMLKTVIAHTVRKYKINCEYKSLEDVELTWNLMIRPIEGFKVSLEHRK